MNRSVSTMKNPGRRINPRLVGTNVSWCVLRAKGRSLFAEVLRTKSCRARGAHQSCLCILEITCICKYTGRNTISLWKKRINYVVVHQSPLRKSFFLTPTGSAVRFTMLLTTFVSFTNVNINFFFKINVSINTAAIQYRAPRKLSFGIKPSIIG